MNPKISNNGTSGMRNPTLDPQAPKTETDEKIAPHFNGIIFAILAVLALGVLLAVWIFYHRGQKIIPHATEKQSVQNLEGLKFNHTSERWLESSPSSEG
jgi:hypothetical protein